MSFQSRTRSALWHRPARNRRNPKIVRPRLHLDRLEDRTVPSTITWIGQDPNNNDGHPADLTDANNWVGGVVPGPSDTEFFTHNVRPDPNNPGSYLGPWTTPTLANATLNNADFDPSWGQVFVPPGC